MIKIEKKIIGNKPFFYLSEQIRVKDGYKKIQVYLGKNIPKDISISANKLAEKEFSLIKENLKGRYNFFKSIGFKEYLGIEKSRISFKYYIFAKTKVELSMMWKKIAIDFIYQSNAIEGSNLSRREIENIVKKKYLKKSIDRKEILEVENSIKAFDLILDDSFKLNQRSIINIHKVLLVGLDDRLGFKKKEIVVNNKNTTKPGMVKGELAELLLRWKKEKGKKYPFDRFADFHQSFERIHPFEDANGRTGRIILNWMMIKQGYGPILIMNRNRQAYFQALSQADEGQPQKLYRFLMKTYKKTIEEIINK